MPPTLASTRARYQQIAKMPERSDVDTGDALGKYLIVTGLRRAFLAEWSPEDEQAARIAMAAALLWRRLNATDPALAETTAGQIAEAWRGGEGATEWLTTLAVRSGIDPDEVLSVASVEYALMVARQSDAELAAQQMAWKLEEAEQVPATATVAVKFLGDQLEGQAMVQYAAWVDLHRGDPSSAKALLAERITGLPDCKEPWNQTDTGRQWLEKATAAQQAEAAGDAEPVKM